MIGTDSAAQLAFDQLATETDGRLLEVATAIEVPTAMIEAITQVAATPSAEAGGRTWGRWGSR